MPVRRRPGEVDFLGDKADHQGLVVVLRQAGKVPGRRVVAVRR